VAAFVVLCVLGCLRAPPVRGQEAAEDGGRAPGARGFTIIEATIPEMIAAMEDGRTSSHAIVTEYLSRIALYEWRLNAVMAVNPRALELAAERDREREMGVIRGPLHGIPIALKDIIQTTDMPTTGGALAFEGLLAPYEATLTRNLREAGAIIIAKTGLTELANWMATGMPANYNAVRGFGLNPYDPRRDPRAATFDGRPALSPGGSSSGTGTAANFWAASVGTETSGSILSPSNQNMLVGIKPTVGRISRHGVIPITADQDTPGPMARTVTDAALLLGAMEGTAPDPDDPATERCEAPPNRDYTVFLKAGGLQGARIGIPRAYYYDPVIPPGTTQRGGLPPEQRRVMEEAIAVLREQGAVIVDPADVPSVVSPEAALNLLLWPICEGPGERKGVDALCSVVFKYGMKRDFNAWLASLGDAAPVKSLTELREWNASHQPAGAMRYGQALLDLSDEMDLDADRARYEVDRARDIALTATTGLDAAFAAGALDALLFPGSSGAPIAARPGYPTVIVPFGTIPNAPSPAFPPAFDALGGPYGVSFTGPACSEPRLVEIAFAFEQATRRRVPPPFPP